MLHFTDSILFDLRRKSNLDRSNRIRIESGSTDLARIDGNTAVRVSNYEL